MTPGRSSRSVTPQSVPSTSAARELSSSMSASVACISCRRDKGIVITTTRSWSNSVMSATIRASMARRVRLFVRNSALFTGPTSMPQPNSSDAMRWVWAVVLLYTKQPVSVAMATYSSMAISGVTAVSSRMMP